MGKPEIVLFLREWMRCLGSPWIIAWTPPWRPFYFFFFCLWVLNSKTWFLDPVKAKLSDHHTSIIYLLGNMNIFFYILRVVITSRPFGWAVWRSCRMGDRTQEQTRGRIGPQLRLGNLRMGELLFQIRLHALYSTRPHGLLQAICWHTCPDLDLGPWNGLTH